MRKIESKKDREKKGEVDMRKKENSHKTFAFLPVTEGKKIPTIMVKLAKMSTVIWFLEQLQLYHQKKASYEEKLNLINKI